jgi:ketosteroid isomerase-like protein
MILQFLSAVAGLALGAFATGDSSNTPTNKEVANLIQRSAEANDALVRGDIEGYLGRIKHSEDYTLMAPFGGPTQKGFDDSKEHRAGMAKFFKAGNFDQEMIATYNSGDLVVLVTVERLSGVIGGLPKQDWSLRVTQVFRRTGSDWELVHRHADPLLKKLSLERAAEIVRGDKQ